MDAIDRYLDGTPNAEEAAELSRAVADDPALADELAHLTRLDHDLRCLMQESERAEVFVRRFARAEAAVAPAAAKVVSWRRPAAVAAGLAACAAGLLALGRLAFRDDPVMADNAGSEPRARTGRPSFAGGGFGPAASGGDRAAADMRRRLRGFHVPAAGIAEAPVTDVLAALEQTWRDLPRRESDGDRPVRFAVDPDVLATWKAGDAEPRAAVAIPAVSMMTCLNLVAAQAGLVVETGPDGAVLTRDSRPVPDGERTWTLSATGAELAEWSEKGIAGNQTGLSITSNHIKFNQVGDRLVDLTLAPEVVEFEGAIRYLPDGTTTIEGVEVETLELLTAADPAPEVMVDLVEPVGPDVTVGFSLTDLDVPAPEVALWRAALEYGASEAVRIERAPGTGVLTATGMVPDLRKVEAVAAAIRESVSAGVAIDGKVVRTASGAEESRPPAIAILTESEYRSQLAEAAPAGDSPGVATIPVIRWPLGSPIRLDSSEGATSATIEVSLAGEHMALTVESAAPGPVVVSADESPAPAATEIGRGIIAGDEFVLPLSDRQRTSPGLHSGDRFRIDLPGETLFLHIRPAAVDVGG